MEGGIEEEIAKLLHPWTRHETWHKLHPTEEDRFNQVLKSVIDKFGTGLRESEIKAGLMRARPEAGDRSISYWVTRADHVIQYLRQNS
ncbi:MAG: hypothetical protein RLO11_00185 [Salinisphaeraceae bacterium]